MSSQIFSAAGNAGSSSCALAGLWTPQLSHQMITEDAFIEQGPDSPEVKMSKSLTVMHGRCMLPMHAHDATHRGSEGNATTVSTPPLMATQITCQSLLSCTGPRIHDGRLVSWMVLSSVSSCYCVRNCRARACSACPRVIT